VSAENIALVRRLFEALSAGDLEAMTPLIEADAELYPMRAQLEGKVYRGHDGLRQLMAELDEDWEYVQMDVDEFREAGDEQLVCLGRLRTRGRSGVDVDVPMGWLWRFRGGKAVYVKAFSNQEDALHAAGLA
jgi:ketosteroid isomerase-like protein